MGPAQKKVKPATDRGRAGFESVQLRFESGLTSEDYVKQKAWLSASLKLCPNHPDGSCSLARHTPYARVEPPGSYVARYYCPESHTTFSLLPDCLASRLSSTLAEVERVAAAVEIATESLEATAQRLRPDIELQGAVRWVRRRVAAVRAALLALKGLRPDVFAGREPTLKSFAVALGVAEVLPLLRELAGPQVAFVPCPVGLGHRRSGGAEPLVPIQHEAGADPPRGEV